VEFHRNFSRSIVERLAFKVGEITQTCYNVVKIQKSIEKVAITEKSHFKKL